MASSAKRRDSKELPLDFSGLMNKLIEHAGSFIELFDDKEQRMKKIISELNNIAEEVKKMQNRADAARTTGAVVLGVSIVGAVFTGGLSLIAGAGAAAGGGVVVYSNIAKKIIENGSAKKVEELGEEFMEIVEPLKEILQDIKTVSETLEQKSTEVQADDTLSDVEEFQKILRRVSELVKMSKEVRNLVMLIVSIINVLPTPEQDQKLRDSIIRSAAQSQKIIDEFKRMKKELKDITGK